MAWARWRVAVFVVAYVAVMAALVLASWRHYERLLPLMPVLVIALPVGLFVWSNWRDGRRDWRRIRYARRLQCLNRGFCPSCGYDIHGSDSRCPECGQSLPPLMGETMRSLLLDSCFADDAKGIVRDAHLEAARRWEGHVGTEHLLLAMVQADSAPAASILRACGVQPADLREQIGETSAARGRLLAIRPLEPTPGLLRTLRATQEEARRHSSRPANTRDLLLSLMRERDSAAAQLLEPWRGALGEEPERSATPAAPDDSACRLC